MKEEVRPPRTARPQLRRGIPTMFQGVLMRSRTEARWAAFFVAVGWRWSYEPYDYEGWIPDFLIRLEKMDALVEIKSTDEDFAVAKQKIARTSYDGIVIVLGQDIEGGVLGEIREPDGPGYVWSALDVFFCLSCGKVSVRPIERCWRCRRCGDGYGNTHIGTYDAQATFRHCSNRVQWMPEGAR